MNKALQLVTYLILNGPFSSHAQILTEPDCSRAICGCWRDATLTYENVVIDKLSGLPVSGIVLKFKGVDEVLTVSDDNGVVSFQIDTRLSPGCGYDSSNNLVFVDTNGDYLPAARTVFQRQKVELVRVVTEKNGCR